jgi:hypothetical protein
VKIQSVSTAPGIATVPRSNVQVPMSNDEATDSGGVVAVVPMLSGDGQFDEGEDDESENDDDEEEVHEINHEKLPKVVVHTHSPSKRQHKSLVWTHLRCIDKHDVLGHEINTDCTHVCVYPLEYEDTEKEPLNVFVRTRHTRPKSSRQRVTTAKNVADRRHERQ